MVSPTLGLLLVGTGSIYPLEQAEAWHDHLKPRYQLVFELTSEKKSRLDVRTPIEHLENIRTILNLPVTQLAVLFNVSRQAIYKWLAKDSTPENDKLKRIIELSKIADSFKEAGVLRGGTLLHIKTADGQSLFDLLKEEKSYAQHIKELLAESKEMEAAYQRSGLAQSKATPTNDWLSSVSIPASCEEL